MMSVTRRRFLQQTSAAAAGLSLAPCVVSADGAKDAQRVLPHGLTIIKGAPRERGRSYGQNFKDRIHAFLEREILQAFLGKPAPRDAMLRYAAACGAAIRGFSSTVHEELEGLA